MSSKNLLRALVAVLCFASITFTKAQSPEFINYQAVVHKTDGKVLESAQIGMQVSILQGINADSVIYMETHTPTTNAKGLISIKIGNGDNQIGNFSAINWADGPYSIKLEIDPEGGTNYSITDTSILASVPYALHAKTADSVNMDLMESDPVFSASPAFSITAEHIQNLENSPVASNDTSPTNEIQALSISNDTIFLSDGGFVKLPASTSSSDDQTLTLLGNTLSIEDGNSVDLSEYVDTDNQQLSRSNDTIRISGGNFIKLPTDQVEDADADPTNEIQNLHISNDTLYLDKTNSFIVLPHYVDTASNQIDDNDKNPTNELQSISISGDTIFLSRGGFAKLPLGMIDTDEQELYISGTYISIENGNSIDLANINTDEQNLYLSNDTLGITGGNYIVLPSGTGGDGDSNPTNELQSISISGDTIFLTNGGFVKLPSSTSSSDDQTLTLLGNTLSIEDGNSVDLSEYVDTDNQQLSRSNDTIRISGGNFIKLPADQVEDADADPTNEIQALSISNDTIYLTNGGFVKLPEQIENIDNQDLTGASLTGTILTVEIENGESASVDLRNLQDGTGTDNQTLSVANDSLVISRGNKISISSIDKQTLSIANDTIYLTNGGYVELPADSTFLKSVASSITNEDTTRWNSSSLPMGDSLNMLTYDGNNWIAKDLLIELGNTGGGQAFSIVQPYLAINFCIATQGVFPSRSSLEPFVGEIAMFGFEFAPRGWAICNGQLLPISSNSALFSLLGTMYGGDGRTTFALPDLIGRTPISYGSGTSRSSYEIGDRGGSETTTLSIGNLPPHTHTVTVSFED